MWGIIKNFFTPKSPFAEQGKDLLAIRLLLGEKHKWCQGSMYRYNDDAYCLWGAYYKLEGSSSITPYFLAQKIHQKYPGEVDHLFNGGDYDRVIMRWNDNPKRTYEEVINLLNELIREINP